MANQIKKILHYPLLLLLLLFNSCNGQVKSSVHEDQKSNDALRLTLSTKLPKPKGLDKEARIVCGIQDNNGNLWFGSNGEGVFCYNGKSFVQYTLKDGLNSNNIYSIVEDKQGTIWVGTNKGLHRFQKDRFQVIPIILLGNPMFSNYTQEHVPEENEVWSLMVDTKGLLWIGAGDGLYCYNHLEFERFIDRPNLMNKDSLQMRAIFSILETKDGNIWFAACMDEGISRFDGNTLTTIIPHSEVRRTDRIIQDKNGTLWFASVFKGVGRYDGKTYTTNVFNEKPIDGPSNIVEDTNGNLWFDTADGLGRYDGKKFTVLGEKDSIPDKHLVPIMEDGNGNLWFSSKGMKLFQYKEGKFINHSEP
jgi:ligand-binding sensor domain-containing protein